jgi:hypothetical protein
MQDLMGIAAIEWLGQGWAKIHSKQKHQKT